MRQSARATDGSAGAARQAGKADEDIEREFLSLYLGLGRLRDKVRQLIRRRPARPRGGRRVA